MVCNLFNGDYGPYLLENDQDQTATETQTSYFNMLQTFEIPHFSDYGVTATDSSTR